MKLKTKEEQLELAKTTKSHDILESLYDSQYMNVRRAVARNYNSSEKIVNILASDPVLNVSYMALKNPNSTVQREISKDILTVCVLCEKDERTLNCLKCENKS